MREPARCMECNYRPHLMLHLVEGYCQLNVTCCQVNRGLALNGYILRVFVLRCKRSAQAHNCCEAITDDWLSRLR
jgi:hypothetical protein